MRRSTLAVGAALAVQAVLVAAIPLHESWNRAHGRAVTLAVDPVGPYDPVRGYYPQFTYRDVGSVLRGFDHHASDGAPVWVTLGPVLREHQAVAELRVTPDGAASLIRLRPSGGGMGHGG